VTEPTEPVTEPTEPVTEPTEPATEPTEPATEPTEPVTEPVAEPVEPAATPVEPVKPAKDAKPIADLSQLMAEGAKVLKLSDLDAIPGTGMTVGELTYKPEEVKEAFKNVATWKKTGLKPGDEGFDKAKAELTDEDLQLTRQDWLAAQSQNWSRFFLYPSLFIFVIIGIFMLIGKEPAKEGNRQG